MLPSRKITIRFIKNVLTLYNVKYDNIRIKYGVISYL